MFSIKGHSGCSVELIKLNGQNVVRKSTADKKYFHRLTLQAEKQLFFKKNNTLEFVSTPAILGHSSLGEQRHYFDMEFCSSLDCVTFLQHCSIDELKIFTEQIITLIDSFFKNSVMQDIDSSVFSDKLKLVIENIDRQNQSPEIIKNYQLIEHAINHAGGPVPIGFCHGDLTLSNMLIKRYSKKLCLIDFLDSFVETPLQDIVKIRQDTTYMWSTFMYEKKVDNTKLKIMLKYIDDAIVERFSGLDFFHKNYKKYQIMNLMRVLQYSKDPKISRYLTENILDLLE